MKKELVTKNAPEAVGAYSQGIETDGLVFTSGQVPINPATGTIPESVTEQAKQAMNNVKGVLEAAGLTMNDVIKTTVLLADINDFAAVNEVYASFFEAPYPARACYAVAAIPKGAKLEVEAIAAKK